jgi:hypothetical protein
MVGLKDGPTEKKNQELQRIRRDNDHGQRIRPVSERGYCDSR